MRTLLLALLPLLAATSGCIFPGGGAAGNGIVILTFEPGFPGVYSGEPVDFRLKIQNQGTVDAINVNPKIIGLETWYRESETCGEWQRVSAAIPEIGAPGESVNCRWTYSAPEVPAGLSTSYSPMVRVYYGYRTSVVKSIMLASSRELMQMRDRGQAVPVQSASQTAGPIQIDIKTEAPVRFWEGSVSFPITITVENIGGGVVCPSESDCEAGQNINGMRLEIVTGNDIDISDCDTNIELWQGKTNTLVCQATFSGMNTMGSAQRTITINTNYGYYIDKTSEVTVSKR